MTNSNITNASEHFQKLLQQQLDRIERMEQSEEKTNYAELDTIKVGIIGGDGIGPYIAAEAQRVLETLLSDELSNGKVTFQVIDDLTIEKRAEVNQAIPDDVLEKIKKCNVTLKGPTTTPRKGDPWPNIESANVAMRKELDLFANVRPVRVPKDGIDWVFFRENTEGAYALGSNGVDVTDDLACLGLFGPKSRKLMEKISKDDLTNENFKFGSGKNITINNKTVWVQRLSYVGELGYELYIDMSKAKEIYNLIVNAGKKYQLSHCGVHAMDIMRMESGFLHWGHDISPEENQYEANLDFTISYKKNI